MPTFEVSDSGLEKSNVVTAVKFSHATLNGENSQHKISWQLYKAKTKANHKGKEKKKEKRLVTAEVDNMKYRGQNFGSNPSTSCDTCDYYVGVLDKQTGKMRVLPAELVQMEPYFEESETVAVEDKITDKSFREKHDALVKEFGSGRSQKAVSRRENNKLETEMLSARTQSVADTSIVREEAAGKADESIITESSVVPPHNKDAKKPEDIYKLKDIIPPQVMTSLAEQAQVMFKGTREDIDAWERENTYPKFVLNKLLTLSVREDARLLQCQCLTYLTCLIKLSLKKQHELRLKDPLPYEWKGPVKKHLLDTFTVGFIEKGKKRRNFPSRLKDKLLSHILVLCLKLSGFSLSLDVLVADLQMASRKLSLHCKTLGCTVKSVLDPFDKKETVVATLSVPLTFPILNPHKRDKFR